VSETSDHRAYTNKIWFQNESLLKRIYAFDNKHFCVDYEGGAFRQAVWGSVKLVVSQAMKKQILFIATLSIVSLNGQSVTDQRSADIRGGGGEGKCTIEVWVDDVAEVDIFGSNMSIRTINGSPATIRRFVCNQAMPNRPVDFRFKGIDGRGRQELLRSAENGGRAIVRIEDNKGGGQGYTFDIFWRGSGGGFGGGGGGSIFGNDNNNRPGNRPGGGGYIGGGNRPGSGGYENDSNSSWNNGWNNGWGNGSGWISNANFDFEGGGRSSGSYRDRNGSTRRLDRARVNIASNGQVSISFQSEDGNIEFFGRVDRRDGRRVYADVRGSGMFGIIELEMSARDRISRIQLDAVGLNWRN